ncbi:hypothetical protein CMO94_00445 [Candidatus Woesearchaeota archaeon]|jgi:hypothetical protein|nr:hypothetical protein [Candidatus Woesearchaeota archaeon]|tara:strand:- start:71 stop:976 length:906 start_codon:yes stop_codon:yes gene_type:complete
MVSQREIKEEGFKQIHELKAEEILTAEEENEIRELLDVLKRLEPAFEAILAESDLSKPGSIAKQGNGGLFVNRSRAMLMNPDDPKFDISQKLREISIVVFDLGRGKVSHDALPRLYRMLWLAKDIRRIIIDVEKGVIKASKIPMRRGKPTIRKIIALEDHERRGISRNLVGLGETRQMIEANRVFVGDIMSEIRRAVQKFDMLRNYVTKTRWDRIDENRVNQSISEFRQNLENAYGWVKEAIPNLETLIDHLDDFKHWLNNSIHKSQRALKFQEKLDKILEEEGIDKYRSGSDRSFGKPWL